MGTLTDLNGIAQTQIPEDIARDAEVASAIAAHNVADWAHIEYLWRVFLPRDRGGHYVGYITDTEVASLIASHVSAVDPHPIYLTQVEGDGRYRQSATGLVDADIPAAIARDAEVTSAIASHVSAVDPHPTYLTQVEGDERYRRSAVVTGSLPTVAGGFIDIPLPLNITALNIVTITALVSLNIGNIIRNIPPLSFNISGAATWYNIHAVSAFPVGATGVSARLSVGTTEESASIMGASTRVFVNY